MGGRHNDGTPAHKERRSQGLEDVGQGEEQLLQEERAARGPQRGRRGAGPMRVLGPQRGEEGVGDGVGGRGPKGSVPPAGATARNPGV